MMEGKMPHTIHYNPETQIIETKVWGTVIADEFKEIFSQGTQLAKDKECFLFLNDFRKASFEMSTMDLYALPKLLSSISESRGIKAYRLRRAIVIAPKDLKDVRFAEDVTVNQGQHAKYFLDMDEARNWLLGSNGERSDVKA